jgi:hypothetical protein
MKKEIRRLYGYNLHSDYRDASKSMRMEYRWSIRCRQVALLVCLLYALATTKTKA